MKSWEQKHYQQQMDWGERPEGWACLMDIGINMMKPTHTFLQVLYPQLGELNIVPIQNGYAIKSEDVEQREMHPQNGFSIHDSIY